MYKYIRGIALCTLMVFCLSYITILTISAHTLTRSSDADAAYQRDVNRKNSERGTDLVIAVASTGGAVFTGCLACATAWIPEPTGATKAISAFSFGACVALIVEACASWDSSNDVPCEGACGTLMESSEASSLHVGTCSNPGHPMINPHQWWTCSPYGTGSTECPHSSEHVHECPGPCTETFNTESEAENAHLTVCNEEPCDNRDYYDCPGYDCPASSDHYVPCRGGCGTLMPPSESVHVQGNLYRTVYHDHEVTCQESVYSFWDPWAKCGTKYFTCQNGCGDSARHQ